MLIVSALTKMGGSFSSTNLIQKSLIECLPYASLCKGGREAVLKMMQRRLVHL